MVEQHRLYRIFNGRGSFQTCSSFGWKEAVKTWQTISVSSTTFCFNMVDRKMGKTISEVLYLLTCGKISYPQDPTLFHLRCLKPHVLLPKWHPILTLQHWSRHSVVKRNYCKNAFLIYIHLLFWKFFVLKHLTDAFSHQFTERCHAIQLI